MCNIRLDGFKGDGLERIIGNLDKAKLKLDEAFFYLDEIEELIQEDELSEAAGSKVTQAAERLTTELSALSGRVAELQDILQALEEQEDAADRSGE
jgi:TolA-binding protein